MVDFSKLDLDMRNVLNDENIISFCVNEAKLIAEIGRSIVFLKNNLLQNRTHAAGLNILYFNYNSKDSVVSTLNTSMMSELMIHNRILDTSCLKDCCSSI